MLVLALAPSKAGAKNKELLFKRKEGEISDCFCVFSLLGDRKKQREAEERGEEYNPADESGDPCCPLFCGDDDGDSRTPLQVKLDVLSFPD